MSRRRASGVSALGGAESIIAGLGYVFASHVVYLFYPMGWDNLMIVALAVTLGALLLAAGVEDARTREIANAKNAAIALLAPLWWWAMGLGWADVGIQLLIAAIVLALFVGAFACGWMGGGDVKMIAALALWLPLGGLVQMLMVMSVLGGAITILMMIERRWERRIGQVEVPYGVAIAAAALLALPATLHAS